MARKHSKDTASQTSKAIGDHAEDIALQYLLDQGLKKLAVNFSSRFGEIDLVMDDRGTTVFVEVRFRKTAYFGGGAASVTRSKQRKLVRTAHSYLKIRRSNGNCRFDVVEVSGGKTDSKAARHAQINWLQNAFSADEQS